VSFSYGMIVSSELMAQLRRRPVMVEHPSLILKTTYRLNNDQRLLHGRGMLSEIGWVEDVVEHYERATGVVQRDQIEKSGNAQCEDMDLFREFNGTLSIDARSSMGYYVVQASWTTLRFGGLVIYMS
jgi:hypothetical protein